MENSNKELTFFKHSFKTLEWFEDQLILLDQRKLPNVEEYVICKSCDDVVDAISNMVVRGAPAIGCAAAFGYVLGAQEVFRYLTKKDRKKLSDDELFKLYVKKIEVLKEKLFRSRPTAINLGWALQRMHEISEKNYQQDLSSLINSLIQEASLIMKEDIETNKKIGETGKGLIDNYSSILTYCNAGALATAGYGTALGVIRSAFLSGKKIKVFASETRPFLQGARLTTWELLKDQIPVTLITDSMCGYLMSKNKIDIIVVGADRVTANGDVINKIGTYTLSVLAKENNVPFYVACPWTTIDLNTPEGKDVEIEERSLLEVTGYKSEIWAPEGIDVFNPAFDITPFANVTGLITEKGIIEPLNSDGLIKLKC
jgi:methylthioribose-1-phosphate isomerase